MTKRKNQVKERNCLIYIIDKGTLNEKYDPSFDVHNYRWRCSCGRKGRWVPWDPEDIGELWDEHVRRMIKDAMT